MNAHRAGAAAIWKSGAGSKLILFLGFGGVLALMAAASLDSIRVLSRLQTRNERITQAFLARNRALGQLRSALYLSSTYIRDYLLDPDPEAARRHLASLRAQRAETEHSLENGLDPGLNRAFREYWQVLDPAFAWTPAERRARGYAFYTRTVMPHRRQVLEAADRIASVNEQQLHAGEDRSQELFADFHRRILFMLFLTMALGMALAAMTIIQILRSAREAQTRYVEAVEARRELQELSARLVQVQEDERRRISRELHDEIGQALTALVVDAGNAAATAPAELADLRLQIQAIKKSAESSIQVVRNLALLLRPSMLDDLGLVPALHWQAREVSRRTGITVEVSAEDVAEELPDELRTCIYRVVQEALHNVSRHAGASSVRIVVRQEPHRILVLIQDDGKGFDARHIRGLGLLGMEERIRYLHGLLEVQSTPGSGTLLKVELPLTHVEAAQEAIP